MNGEAIPVAIGIIGRAGRFLIRQRPPLPGSPMPGVWEFPGGKCHAGETPGQCVLREVLEEVGVEVRVVRLRCVVRHLYPHGDVELHFFDCVTLNATAEPAAGSGFRWATASELPRLEFPGANDVIIAELVAEHAI
jgi:mutator protein MutT